MLQTTRKPVTVYRNTDDHAPQLTAAAGSLKTILKACLVEGYGNKPSLGWEMPFEDAHSAVFRSKNPKSPGMALQIKNPQPRGAEARMMINPTALDKADAILAKGQAKFPYLRGYDQGGSGRTWMVIGHDSAFALLLTGSQSGVRLLWFGDFPSLVAADTGNCLLYCGDDNSADYLSSLTYEPTVVGTGGNNHFVLGKSFDGLSNGTPGYVLSLVIPIRGLPYPDLITGGLSMSECFIAERVFVTSSMAQHPLRGLWPGVYYSANNLSPVADYAELTGFPGTDDRYLKVGLNDSGGTQTGFYLINLTAWEA